MITFIGLGAGSIETLSRGAECALRDASQQSLERKGFLLLRTAIHPSVAALVDWNLKYETCDSFYQNGTDFASLYAHIADHVLELAQRVGPDGSPLSVWFAVPGHPLFAEESVRQIRERAVALGIETRIIASGSFVEAALSAVGVSLGDGCDIRDALALSPVDRIDAQGFPVAARIDTGRGLLLYQVFDTAAASQTKLALMRDYPDDWEVAAIHAAGVPDQESVRWLPLFRLDREPVDHLTSVFVPPLPPTLRRSGFTELTGLMARLRAPDGCPWDREQTHATLRKYFIEETYEVLEAIDADDSELLCEELGDALLQVVFHAQLASEEGVFTIDDVCAGIVEKLVRRHPHVFGTVDVADSAEVLRNWEQIKRAEKTENEAGWRPSLLDGIPKGLPALMAAMEVSKRVVKVGFEWEQFADVLAKLDEETAELKAELAATEPDKTKIASELGDLLFTIVQVARWQKVDPEDALRGMLRRFGDRFRFIERRAAEQQRALTELSLPEMDALWEEAKKAR